MKNDLIKVTTEFRHIINFNTSERDIEIDEDDSDELSKCYDIKESSTKSLYNFLTELYETGNSDCINNLEELENIQNDRDEIIKLIQCEIRTRLEL